MKCICIKRGKWTAEHDLQSVPRHGDVLTIRTVAVASDGTLFLRFIEHRNLPLQEGSPDSEPQFHISRFAPLVTRTLEQDLKIFEPLLNTKEDALQ